MQVLKITLETPIFFFVNPVCFICWKRLAIITTKENAFFDPDLQSYDQ